MKANSYNDLTQDDIDAMPVERKLELVEALWDSIESSSEDVDIPDWHKPLIEKSLKDLEDFPDDYVTWEQAKKNILNKL